MQNSQQNQNFKQISRQKKLQIDECSSEDISENLITKKQTSQNQIQSTISTLDEFIQVPIQDLSADQGTTEHSTLLISQAQINSKKQKANMAYTTLTVMNCTIGIGVLAMPYTIYKLGWLFSLISFIIITFLNQYSIIILLKVKNLTKHSNYSTISSYVLKRKLFCILVSSLICIGNFGYCNIFNIVGVALFSIMRGTGRKMLQDFIQNQQILNEFYTSQWFIVLIGGVLSFPTILVKKIQTLRYTALAGVLGIIFSLIAYLIIFFTEMSERNWENSYEMRAFPQSILSTLAVIPNIGLGLVYQMNFFSIFKGMSNPTDKRARTATTIGTISSALIYLALGLMGYCLFGQQQTPNFLLSIVYGQINLFLYLMIYIGFLVSVFFCVSVNSMVVRNNFLAILMLFKTQQTNRDINKFQQINKSQKIRKQNRTLIIISIGVHILALLIAILVQSLQSVFNFAGAISSTSIGFIIPFTFYYILIKKKNKKKNINFYLSLTGMIIFIPFGIIAVISLYI